MQGLQGPTSFSGLSVMVSHESARIYKAFVIMNFSKSRRNIRSHSEIWQNYADPNTLQNHPSSAFGGGLNVFARFLNRKTG